MILALIILWLLIGLISVILIFKEDNDITIKEIPSIIFGSILGLISLWIYLDGQFNFSNKVIFRKRQK